MLIVTYDGKCAIHLAAAIIYWRKLHFRFSRFSLNAINFHAHPATSHSNTQQ